MPYTPPIPHTDATGEFRNLMYQTPDAKIVQGRFDLNTLDIVLQDNKDYGFRIRPAGITTAPTY